MRDLAALVVFALVAVLAGWFWLAGPCEVYRYSATADVPARCVMGDQ